MRCWTIQYPGEYGQHVQETFSEYQIIASYCSYWNDKMRSIGKQDLISNARCIDDWKVIHWAIETDEFGNCLDQLEAT